MTISHTQQELDIIPGNVNCVGSYSLQLKKQRKYTHIPSLWTKGDDIRLNSVDEIGDGVMGVVKLWDERESIYDTLGQLCNNTELWDTKPL